MVNNCKFCGKEIYWQNLAGLWVCFEDRTCDIRHLCRTHQSATTTAPEDAPVIAPLPAPPETKVNAVAAVESLTGEEVHYLKSLVFHLKAVA